MVPPGGPVGSWILTVCGDFPAESSRDTLYRVKKWLHLPRPPRLEPFLNRILFICMGNICRSPVAEGLFIHHVNERSLAHRFEVDSAGTGGWHAGDPPDRRSTAVAARNGVTLVSQARQVVTRDFEHFDLLVCMDEQNVEELLEMECPPDRIRTLMSYAPDLEHGHVPDPYYGGEDGFELMYRLIDTAVLGLVDSFD